MKVTNSEELYKKIEELREAQKKFATYTQDQVDDIFRAAAMAANNARIKLSKIAVEESGMGIVEDKVIKNHFAAEYIYNQYKDMKTFPCIPDNKLYIGYQSHNPYIRPINKGGLIWRTRSLT